MRLITAYLIAPFMAIKGYLFSKNHRHEEKWQYRCIDTVAANRIANAIKPL